jgi:hypothetical protein
MVDQAPSIVFNIGPTITNGRSVNITMPYSSFDLEIGYPYVPVGGSRRYFPIRRADGEEQYILGRAFLQNAYLVVDYDRGSFSVSQAILSDTSSVMKDIVAIHRPGSTQLGQVSQSTTKGLDSPSSLSTGAIAGISAGSAAGLALGILFSFMYYRRQHRQTKSAAGNGANGASASKPELEGSGNIDRHEAECIPANYGHVGALEIGDNQRYEMSNSHLRPELPTPESEIVVEMDGACERYRAE